MQRKLQLSGHTNDSRKDPVAGFGITDERKKERKKDRMNEWMNEWMNE